jgi:hypothetical protein
MAAKPTLIGPDTFIKQYEFDMDLTAIEETVKFLREFARQYPTKFIPKLEMTRIAYHLRHTPKETSAWFEGIGAIVTRANEVLEDKFKQCVVHSRMFGLRATWNADDYNIFSARRRQKQIATASTKFGRSIRNTEAMKDQLSPDMLREHEQRKKTMPMISTMMGTLPPLPATTSTPTQSPPELHKPAKK